MKRAYRNCFLAGKYSNHRMSGIVACFALAAELDRYGMVARDAKESVNMSADKLVFLKLRAETFVPTWSLLP